MIIFQKGLDKKAYKIAQTKKDMHPGRGRCISKVTGTYTYSICGKITIDTNI